MNQCHGLLCDETLLLSYQKVPKVKISCSYSKESNFFRLEKSLKSRASLHNKRCSLMAESLLHLALLPVSTEIHKCSHIL